MEEKLSTLDQMIAELNNEIISTSAQITNLNDKIKFNNDKSADLDNHELKYCEELKELNQKINENDANLVKVKIELENMEAESKNEDEQLKMKELELDQIKFEFDLSSETVEEKKSSVMNTFHDQSRIQNEIGNQTTLKDTLKNRRSRIENQQSEILKDLDHITQSRHELDIKHEELTGNIEEHSNKRSNAKETISTLNNEINSRSNDISELEKLRSSKQARLEVLEDYETRAEGVDAGAKAVLKESSSPGDAIPEVCGLVADLIKVDLDLARAIEAALGDLVQSVVTRNHDDTIKAIDFLRDTDAGHATFLPLDKVKLFKYGTNGEANSGVKSVNEELSITDKDIALSTSTSAGIMINHQAESIEPLSDVERSKGIIGKASRLIEYSDEFKSIVNYMLDKTLIVENFSKASSLIGSIYNNNGYCSWLDKEYGEINRIITLDGSLIEKYGIIRGGVIREKPGLISRRSEMDSIKKEIVNVDQKIITLLEERTLRVEKLNIAENDLACAVDEIEKLNILLLNNKNEQKQEENRVLKLNDERNVIISELKEIELNIESIEKRNLELTEQLNTLNQDRAELENEIESISNELEAKEGIRFAVQEDITHVKIAIAQKKEKQDAANQLLNHTENNVKEFRERLRSVNLGIEECRDKKAKAINDKGEWEQNLNDLNAKKKESEDLLNSQTGEREFLADQLSEIKNELSEYSNKHKGVENHLHKLQLQENECQVKAADLEERIVEEHRVSLTELEKILYGLPEDENIEEEIVEELLIEEENKTEETIENSSEITDSDEEENVDAEDVDAEDSGQSPVEEKSDYIYELVATFTDEEMDWESVSIEIEELRSKLSKIGNVNLDAIQEQEELEARSEFLTVQLNDLNTSENSLSEIIEKLNETSRELFEKTFNDIKENFHIYFRKLFGGGRATISLESDVDILDANIEIVIQPPNKEFKAIALFSGGEKVLITVALLFAIFKSKPSPFCLMDEVDAALDESNVGRFTMVLKEFAVDSQFIIISHNKKTMSVADAIYGVTMEEPGVSKKIAVKFNKFD